MNIIQQFYIKGKNDAQDPMRSTTGSAGYDLFSETERKIPTKETIEIELPVSFEGELNKNLELKLFVRSSYGFKKKIRLKNEKNEIVPFLQINEKSTKHVVRLYNDQEQDLIIPKGEHFAQILIVEKEPVRKKLLPIKIEKKDSEIPYKTRINMIEPNFYQFMLEEDLTFEPYEQKVISTGLMGKIEEGTWLGIKPSEEVGGKLILANGFAIGDYDFFLANGEYKIAFVNKKGESIIIKKGTPIAIWWSENFYIFENEIKSEKARTGGIGSTTNKKGRS